MFSFIHSQFTTLPGALWLWPYLILSAPRSFCHPPSLCLLSAVALMTAYSVSNGGRTSTRTNTHTHQRSVFGWETEPFYVRGPHCAEEAVGFFDRQTRFQRRNEGQEDRAVPSKSAALLGENVASSDLKTDGICDVFSVGKLVKIGLRFVRMSMERVGNF